MFIPDFNCFKNKYFMRKHAFVSVNFKCFNRNVKPTANSNFVTENFII